MIETLFSLFFIATTLLLTTQLILTATRLQREVDKALGGAYLAEQLLARVRAQARQSGSPPSSSSGTDYDHPAFRYQVEVVSASLYSPCSSRELQFPAAERRSLDSIGHHVKVTVSWAPFNARNRAVAYGLILRKLPTMQQLNVDADSGNTTPVKQNQSAEFVVNATDTSGNLIQGVFFHWYSAPKTGNGLALSKRRDGARGQFVHIYKNPYRSTPVYFPAGSECLVQARARFNGKEFVCDSPAIPLSDLP